MDRNPREILKIAESEVAGWEVAYTIDNTTNFQCNVALWCIRIIHLEFAKSKEIFSFFSLSR